MSRENSITVAEGTFSELDKGIKEYLVASPSEKEKMWSKIGFTSQFPHVAGRLILPDGLTQFPFDKRGEIVDSSLTIFQKLMWGHGSGEGNLGVAGYSFKSDGKIVSSGGFNTGEERINGKEKCSLLSVEIASLLLLGLSLGRGEDFYNKFIDDFYGNLSNPKKETFKNALELSLVAGGAIKNFLGKFLGVEDRHNWNAEISWLLLNLPEYEIKPGDSGTIKGPRRKIPSALLFEDFPERYSKETVDIFINYMLVVAYCFPITSIMVDGIDRFTDNLRRFRQKKAPDPDFDQEIQTAIKTLRFLGNKNSLSPSESKGIPTAQAYFSNPPQSVKGFRWFADLASRFPLTV